MDALNAQQIKTCEHALITIEKEIYDLIKISSHAAETVTLDQSKVGRISRIDAMQQQAMAVANLVAYQKKLSLIKVALNKIPIEAYGFCESCDELIAFQRLLIRPESPLCIQCQEKSEIS